MSERPVCFVIAPIGKESSDVRERSDLILKYVITPVADECGYDTKRADQISEPGQITTQVINHVLNDAMVVADLTNSNANVFYELAVRHACHKPVVQIIQKGERIPFDVLGMRTIEIDHTNLESVATAKEEIKRQMRHTAENPTKVESPISVAIDFEKLRQSGDPEKRQLADILQNLGELRTLIEKRPQGTIFILKGDQNTLSRASEDLIGKADSSATQAGLASDILRKRFSELTTKTFGDNPDVRMEDEPDPA